MKLDLGDPVTGYCPLQDSLLDSFEENIQDLICPIQDVIYPNLNNPVHGIALKHTIYDDLWDPYMKLDIGTQLDLWDDLIYKLIDSLKDTDPCFQVDRMRGELPRRPVWIITL